LHVTTCRPPKFVRLMVFIITVMTRALCFKALSSA
jgi:hypothetical protein